MKKLISYSISPNGEKFEIPDTKKTDDEIARIKEICDRQRKSGKEIVVVQGLGFVGAVTAAVIADCKVGEIIPYFVIGVNLPSKRSFWKIPLINNGKSPFNVEDPELQEIFSRTVNEKNNFIATWTSEAYSEADIILVDINLDAIKPDIGKAETGYVDISNFKKAIHDIGKRIQPHSLLLIESTVPPGTTEYIVRPIIEQCFIDRGIEITEYSLLLAHSYERVMPGPDYVKSIKAFWRTYSGCNKIAANKTQKFLSDIIDTKKYPLWELPRPLASELAKVMENSYRAMNIAFIHEWTLFAEDININLFEVIDSIRVRKGTHDNMMYPGFGVGGYCLTKDTILAQWASKQLFDRDERLKFSIEAINVNDLMPLHTFDLLLKGMKNTLSGKKIAILGASYRNDVDDTRSSPTIALYDYIQEAGGTSEIHDPYATSMDKRPDVKISSDLFQVITGASAVVFVIKHKQYIDLPLSVLIDRIDKDACIIDAFNVLSDKKIQDLKKRQFIVLGVGKGHIIDN